MSKNEKLRKLGNAVREYRGSYHPKTKAWIHAPKRHSLERVRKWLSELNVDVVSGVAFIDRCETWIQFREWIADL